METLKAPSGICPENRTAVLYMLPFTEDLRWECLSKEDKFKYFHKCGHYNSSRPHVVECNVLHAHKHEQESIYACSFYVKSSIFASSAKFLT